MSTRTEMSLLARLGLDATQMEAGFNRVRGFVAGQVRDLAGMLGGAFTAQAAIGKVRDAMASADEIRDSADALGITAEQVQVLRDLANDTGANLNKMEQALFAVAKAEANMVGGGEQAEKLRAAYDRLGVSMDDLRTKSPAQILEQIGRRLAQSGDDAETMRAVMDALGDGINSKVVAAFRQLGSTGFDAWADNMAASGKLMSDTMVDQLDRAKKALDDFDKRVTVSAGWAVTQVQHLFEVLGSLSAGRTIEQAMTDMQGADAVERQRRIDELMANVEKANPLPVSQQTISGGAGGGGGAYSYTGPDPMALAARQRQSAAVIDAQMAAEKQAAAETARQAEAQRAADQARAAKAAEDERARANLAAAQQSERDFWAKERAAGVRRRADDAERADELAREAGARAVQIRNGKMNPLGDVRGFDDLSRFGGYVGDRSGNALRIAEQQLEVQKELKQLFEQVRDRLGDERAAAVVNGGVPP